MPKNDLNTLQLPGLLLIVMASLFIACSSDSKIQEVETPKDVPTTEAQPSGSKVKTSISGLKYQILKEGNGGASPRVTDTVQVHYHGTLLDGSVFDSSVERGQPATFPLNRVIKGWTEGLQLMRVGDKYKFEIPPDLAYGSSSPSPAIPPNSTLVFEVELLAIK